MFSVDRPSSGRFDLSPLPVFTGGSNTGKDRGLRSRGVGTVTVTYILGTGKPFALLQRIPWGPLSFRVFTPLRR